MEAQHRLIQRLISDTVSTLHTVNISSVLVRHAPQHTTVAMDEELDFTDEQNVCGQTLLTLVARGNAIIAEVCIKAFAITARPLAALFDAHTTDAHRADPRLLR